ncbi:Protein GIGAS CELL1 [Hirschfeldia incana]|nr:Protein GIGAS CELL1 [Hirschfeldia incana]
MPEARDRTERPVDYAAIFANRRRNGVLLDEAALLLGAIEHPVQRLPSGSAVYAQRGSLIGGNYSSWRPGNGSASGRISPFGSSHGRENPSRRVGRGGGASRSPLPSWYPRKPLRDITHILRAIERKRRAGMGVDNGLEDETPTQHQVSVLETPVALGRERSLVLVTPGPAMGLKRSCPPSTAKVRKMLLDITKGNSAGEEEEEAGFITPEKKLLNSIDVVEKIVMAEIQKLKSTPLAKREEREKRVKTLMSMR